MPNITVSERAVAPKLDYGLITGLIAGVFVAVWVTFVGALSGGAASTPVYISSLALGNEVFDKVGFNGNWLVGSVLHFALFVLLGILYAALWPRLRQYGTWTPSVLYWLAAYLIVFQVLGRIISPEMAGHLNDFGLVTGFIIAGFVCAYRYRRA